MFTVELTAIEIVFLISTVLNFLAIVRLDRSRQVLRIQTDIHSTEAAKYQDMRLNFQNNYDQALATAKLAVEGFERMSNSMDHFMREGDWPKTEPQPDNVTPLPSRAPTDKGDGQPPSG